MLYLFMCVLFSLMCRISNIDDRSQHTSAALTVNENYDKGALEPLKNEHINGSTIELFLNRC